MENKDVCPLCGNFAKIEVYKQNIENKLIECETCGHFLINDILRNKIEYDTHKTFLGKKWYLSAITRTTNLINDINYELTNSNINGLIDESSTTLKFFEKIDKILMYVYNSTPVAGDIKRIRATYDYPVAFCRDEKEMSYILGKMYEMDYIKRNGNYEYLISTEGWKRIDTILTGAITTGNQCFIAMSFAAKHKYIFKEGFKPVINEEVTGYKAMRIDMKQHNGKIDDHIVAEIRKSRIMVADLTGNRNGVYFEAGFAKGLGIEVIWTCKKEELKKVHFDTRQYNFIDWKDTEDLKKRLIDRIQATAPLKK